MTEEQQEELTTTEAAALLGVNQSRIRQLIRSGTLPATRVFARGQSYWVVQRSDVEVYARLPRRPGRKPKGADS